jgi:hypothetical protein
MAQEHPSSEDIELKETIRLAYQKYGQEAFFHPIEDIVDKVFEACKKWRDKSEVDDGK